MSKDVDVVCAKTEGKRRLREVKMEEWIGWRKGNV